jgi:methylated-DNA-[protein]-cysteine S-methyltransferase
MEIKRESTEFEKRVYKEISKIPKGKVITYGELAKALKSSPRAVGQALKRNPNALIVPCHRVIHSDGRIGGYNGIKNSRKKIKLLKNEGVSIVKGSVVRGALK